MGGNLVTTPAIRTWRSWYLELVRGRLVGLVPMLLRGLLAMLSIPVVLAASLRNWLYDFGWFQVTQVSVPVISVGNLTMGGTGKTPAVEYVARLLNEEGWRVAILSRGYGAEDGRNDEAMVLEENLPEVPHLQGRDRVELAWIALEELEAEVLVLDDAMQHRRMARSLDLVLLDATDPWGGNGLLPRGLLREPRSGLRRAQCVLLTRCDQVDETTKHRIREVVTRIAPAVPIVESVHEPTLLLGPAGMEADLELLREHPLGAFCGIGNPLAFRATLEKLGGRLVDFLGFPDHHPYDREDVNKLHAWAERLPEDVVIVTTQKDWVKLRVPQLGGRPLWAVRIALRLTVGQDVLESMLKEVAGAQGVATR